MMQVTEFIVDGIPGWFDWEAYTDRVVETAPPGAVLVELGVFLGRSLSYLAKAAKAADKGLTVVGIDTFRGSPEFEGRIWFDDLPPSQWPTAKLISEAFGCMLRDEVLDDVTLIVGDSAASAKLFAPHSVWSVFVDAGHEEEDVLRDVAAWRGKVMAGGFIGGHDYWTFPGVKAAVDAAFPDSGPPESQPWWEANP